LAPADGRAAIGARDRIGHSPQRNASEIRDDVADAGTIAIRIAPAEAANDGQRGYSTVRAATTLRVGGRS